MHIKAYPSLTKTNLKTQNNSPKKQRPTNPGNLNIFGIKQVRFCRAACKKSAKSVKNLILTNMHYLCDFWLCSQCLKEMLLCQQQNQYNITLTSLIVRSTAVYQGNVAKNIQIMKVFPKSVMENSYLHFLKIKHQFSPVLQPSYKEMSANTLTYRHITL